MAAGALIEEEGRFLMVQEQKPKVYGLWNWPAGRVQKDEPPEACAVREVLEETGLTIELLEKVGDWPSDYFPDGYKTLFLGKIIGGTLSIKKDELLDAKWFSKEEILNLGEKSFRSQWVLEALKKLQ